MELIKQPPADVPTEALILSCVLNDRKVVPYVVNALSQKHFYKTAHKMVYLKMLELFRDDKEITIPALLGKFSREDLKIAGGVEYLLSLDDAVLSSFNYQQYINTVSDKSTLRTLLSEAKAIIDDCERNDGTSSTDKIKNIQERILSITTENDKDKSKHVAECVSTYLDKIEKIRSCEIEDDIFTTGLYDLDRIVKIKRGNFVVIGALPSVGKSVLSNMIAFGNAKKGHKVACFSLEMTNDELTAREISNRLSIDLSRLNDPKGLTLEDLSRIAEEADEMSKEKMYIDDSGLQTVSSLRAKCMMIKAKLGGLDLIVIDYIQLMTPEKGGNREQEVAGISRELKAIAKDLNVPVISPSQLNGNNEVRESKGIEQDADIFMTIYRPKFKQRELETFNFKGNVIDLQKEEAKSWGFIDVSKNRNGQTGSFEIWFVGKHQRFVDYGGQLDYELPQI